jgi:hypothetical protein
LGILGILGIENRKPKTENFQAGNNYGKNKLNLFIYLFLFLFLFLFSSRPRGRIFTVSADDKTRPGGKCGRGRMSGRRGRPDGNFHPKTSFMTSLGSAGGGRRGRGGG